MDNIGRIQWSIGCPRCDYSFWTFDPDERVVPEHKVKDESVDCPGSGKKGWVIERKVDPRILG